MPEEPPVATSSATLQPYTTRDGGGAGASL